MKARCAPLGKDARCGTDVDEPQGVEPDDRTSIRERATASGVETNFVVLGTVVLMVLRAERAEGKPSDDMYPHVYPLDSSLPSS